MSRCPRVANRWCHRMLQRQDQRENAAAKGFKQPLIIDTGAAGSGDPRRTAGSRASAPAAPKRSLGARTQVAYRLVDRLVARPVLDLCAAAGQEPVLATGADQGIGRAIITDGRAIEREGAVRAAAEADVVDAGGVVVARRPFGENRGQSHLILVVRRGTSDEDIIARVTDELIGAIAADQQIAPRAAGEP